MFTNLHYFPIELYSHRLKRDLPFIVEQCGDSSFSSLSLNLKQLRFSISVVHVRYLEILEKMRSAMCTSTCTVITRTRTLCCIQSVEISLLEKNKSKISVKLWRNHFDILF